MKEAFVEQGSKYLLAFLLGVMVMCLSSVTLFWQSTGNCQVRIMDAVMDVERRPIELLPPPAI